MKDPKSKQDKKKKKKGKVTKTKAIDEVKAKALFDIENQRDELIHNMEQIQLLKNFLGNKMMAKAWM